MTSKFKQWRPDALLVDYREIGTVSIKEFADALMEDAHALEDLYSVRFVTASRLYVPVTNQYGDRLRVFHPDGRPVDRIDTHHYRPACLDYDV